MTRLGAFFVRFVSVLLVFAPLHAAYAQPVTPGKKGLAIGAAFDSDGSRLNRMHVAWYYNWTMKPNSAVTSGCFVPMYWGKRGQLQTIVDTTRDPYPALLILNEPDFKNQANRTISEALDEAPSIGKLAVRVSAPTAARPFDTWMRDYMVQAAKRGIRSDFVPVHWYGAPDSDRFIDFLERLHALYKKPLWITEFAVADWHSTKYGTKNRFSEDDVVKFIRQTLPRLERLDYVERYAWLAADTDKESLRPSLLFAGDGKLTKVGLAYAEFNYRKEGVAYCGEK